MDVRGYSDIAYNALIGPNGRIYEGRSIDAYGAHSDGEWNGLAANQYLLGICFLGNFEDGDRLTARAKDAALTLEYVWGLRLGRRLAFLGHRETKPTACPGDDVIAWIDSRR
jgi:N-acetylmuramoyl-L-alanine amidase